MKLSSLGPCPMILTSKNMDQDTAFFFFCFDIQICLQHSLLFCSGNYIQFIKIILIYRNQYGSSTYFPILTKVVSLYMVLAGPKGLYQTQMVFFMKCSCVYNDACSTSLGDISIRKIDCLLQLLHLACTEICLVILEKHWKSNK